MKGDPTFWIVVRSSGFSAYVLMTTSVVAGLVLKSRPFGRSLPPAVVTDLHRFLALLGLGFIAVHGLALVGDSVVHVTVPALLVPGLIPYRPVWTGIGIVAAELTVLVYISFSLRRWIGARNWRRLHWTTYAIFGAVTVHGLGSGTDTGRPWATWLYVGSVAAVLLAATWRFVVVPEPSGTGRRALSES